MLIIKLKRNGKIQWANATAIELFPIKRPEAMRQINGTREAFTQEKSSSPTGLIWNTLGRQYGRRFIVSEHQYGRSDVIGKRSTHSILQMNPPKVFIQSKNFTFAKNN